MNTVSFGHLFVMFMFFWIGGLLTYGWIRALKSGEANIRGLRVQMRDKPAWFVLIVLIQFLLGSFLLFILILLIVVTF